MATKDFNISPYYDDYESSKGFHRVLFKPSFAVQARELTQLQTILQNQVKNTTDVRNGQALTPGELILDTDLSYVALTTDLSGTDTISNIVGTVIATQQSGTTGDVYAKVVAATAREVLQISNDDALTIWVSYLKSGASNATFANGNSLYKMSSGSTLDTSSVWNTVGRHVNADNPTAVVGSGSAVHIRAGVYYINGYAVEVADQTLILDKYTTTPSYKIGFDVAESIITTTEDSSLTDNAVSSTNYQADGADRFKISLTLAKKSLTATTSVNFIEIAEVVNGKLHKKAENIERSKGYKVISGFDYELRENKTTMTDANGLSGIDASGSSDKVSFGVSKGVAEINGVETKLSTKTFIELDKARTIENSTADVSASAEIGNYVVTDGGITADWAQGGNPRQLLNFSPAVTANDAYPSPLVDLKDESVFIGTARIRNIERFGNEFKIYLFDVIIDSGKNLVNVNELHYWSGASTPSASNKLCDLKTESSSAIITTDGVDTTLTSLKDTGKNSLVYPIGKGISAFDSTVIISSIRQTFLSTASGTTITVTAPTNHTFDADTTKILVYGNDGVKNKMFGSSDLTITLNGTKQTATITGATVVSGQSYTVFATLSNNVATRVAKSLSHRSTVFTTKTAVEKVSLDLSDGDILPVQWKVYMSPDFATGPLSSHTDITDRYTLDTGQRDNFYTKGYLNLKSGHDYPTGRIVVSYWYFVQAAGDYISASSYPIASDGDTTADSNLTITDSYGTWTWASAHDGSQQFKYADIPVYTSDTTGQKYRLGDCIDLRGLKNSNGLSNSAFKGSGSNPIHPPTSAIVSGEGSDFYLGRIDMVYLDTDGNLQSVKGAEGSNPTPPNVPYSGIPLYTIKFMPYTHGTDDVVVQKFGSKEYDDFAFFHALSALENSAKSYNIGVGRLRRNVFVDPFVGHGFGDNSDSDYLASIDPINNELRPHFTEDNLEFEVFSSNASTDLVHDSNLITFPYTSTPEVQNLDSNIDQKIRVSDVTTYQGVVSVGYDKWKSVNSRENIRYNRNGAWDSIKNLGKSRQTQGTIWNGWETHWTGYKDSNFQEPSLGLSYNELTKSPVQPNVATLLSKKIGNKNLGTHYVPYIRSQTITITVEGLKPLSSVTSVKFDGIDITSSVNTGTKTDVNGKWSSNYIIPNVDENSGTSKFQTGSKQIVVVGDQSYAEGYFHALGYVDSDGLSTKPLDSSWDDQTNEAVSQGIEIFSECFVTSLDLYFSAEDTFVRPVIIQLRTIENGKVSNVVLPYSTVSAIPSGINIDGTETKFTFSNPVYLKKGKYAITIISPSSEYTVKALDVESNKGSNAVGVDGLYLGKTEVKNKILKFSLNRAKFNLTGSTHNIILQTKNSDLKLEEQSIYTDTSAPNRITIYKDGHGFIAGQTVQFNGIKGQLEQDILMLSGSGNYTVGEVVFKGSGTFSYGNAWGKVIAWDSSSLILKVASISGSFSAADTITGVTSQVSRNVSSVSGAVNTPRRLHGVGIGVPSGFDTYVNGTNYTADSTAVGVATSSSGNGIGLRVNTTVTDGGVTGATIVFAGSGYVDNEVITVSGGDGNATFQINGVTGMNDDTFTVDSVTANSFVIKNDTTAFTIYQDGYAEGETTATISSARRKADLIRYGGEEIIPSGTSISYQESVANNMIGATNVGLNANIEYSTPSRFIQKFLKASFVGDSNNDRVSPAIDLSSLSAIWVSNSVDSSGSSAYISRKLELEESANAITVAFDGKPSKGSGIDVYVKTLTSAGNTNFDTESWVQLTQQTATTDADSADFDEYVYSKDGMTDFSIVAVKIVMKGSNSSRPSRIKNLKVIPNYKDSSLLPLQTLSLALSKNAVSATSFNTTNITEITTDFVVETALVYIVNAVNASTSAVLATGEGAVELLRGADGKVTPLETSTNTGCTVRFRSVNGTSMNIDSIVTLFGRRI